MPIPGLVVLGNQLSDRAAWLEARKPLITATQAAAISGSSPYTKLIDVWNEKLDGEWVEEPNEWLQVRAALGRDAEDSIVEWASTVQAVKTLEDAEEGFTDFQWAHLQHTWTPNADLVANPDDLTIAERTGLSPAGCTPDAWRTVEGLLEILDAKSTQQNWHRTGGVGVPKGIPQHVVDQMLWSWKVTRCSRIFLAVRQVEWKGKGARATATIVDEYLLEVPLDEGALKRLRFLEERVGDFLRWLSEGVAPESDLNIADAAWDDENLEEWVQLDSALSELAGIRAKLEPLQAREAELVAELKAGVKSYDGRRVHLNGSAGVVKLTRYYRENLDKSQLDWRELAAATSWTETETVKIETASTADAEDSTERENA